MITIRLLGSPASRDYLKTRDFIRASVEAVREQTEIRALLEAPLPGQSRRGDFETVSPCRSGRMAGRDARRYQEGRSRRLSHVRDGTSWRLFHVLGSVTVFVKWRSLANRLEMLLYHVTNADRPRHGTIDKGWARA
jgi:hypothetical protein